MFLALSELYEYNRLQECETYVLVSRCTDFRRVDDETHVSRRKVGKELTHITQISYTGVCLVSGS